MEPTVEYLAEELKKIVGWGAQPKHLAVMLHLRSFAQVEDDAVAFIQTGYLIRRKLIGAIDSLSGSFEFHGKTHSAEVMKRAYRLLFKIEGTGQDAVERRGRAIALLGVHYTVDCWRRPFGAEWDFLLLLAERML